MALFGSLSERLNHIFSKLTKRGKLTELEIRTAMREVRVALLEADVNLKVAKQFIADVSEKAVGQEILSSLNPAQQVIKIVNEELIALMGAKNAKLEVSPKLPTVIMMCGWVWDLSLLLSSYCLIVASPLSGYHFGSVSSAGQSCPTLCKPM